MAAGGRNGAPDALRRRLVGFGAQPALRPAPLDHLPSLEHDRARGRRNRQAPQRAPPTKNGCCCSRSEAQNGPASCSTSPPSDLTAASTAACAPDRRSVSTPSSQQLAEMGNG